MGAKFDEPLTPPFASRHNWATVWLPVTAFLTFNLIGYLAPALYAAVFEHESGAIEHLQVATLILSFALVLIILRNPDCRADRWMCRWLVLIGLGSLLMIGEELSYGQHYFHWQTPSWLGDVNKQSESNLHNTSSWFNEKPRLLLELAVVLAGIVHPLLKRWRGRGLIDRPWWLMPGPEVLTAAVLAELAMVPERLHNLGLVPDSWLVIRYSELQELMFFYVLVVYLFGLRSRLIAGYQSP